MPTAKEPELESWAEWEAECRTEESAAWCAEARVAGEELEHEPPLTPAEEANEVHCVILAAEQHLSTWACDPETGELLEL